MFENLILEPLGLLHLGTLQKLVLEIDMGPYDLPFDQDSLSTWPQIVVIAM